MQHQSRDDFGGKRPRENTVAGLKRRERDGRGGELTSSHRERYLVCRGMRQLFSTSENGFVGDRIDDSALPG